MRRHRRHLAPFRSIENLEGRTLFVAWGADPALIRLDDLANNDPQLTGSGQTVAVLDTGIDYTHPSLGGGFGPGFKVVGGYDFVDSDNDPMDTNGHGTEVAGVIASDEFESGGFTYRGIAPDAKLVALRIAPDTNAIPLDRIEDALQWVIANNNTYHFSAVNLSFGFGRYDTAFANPTLTNELQELHDLNIPFVASAGNGGVSDGPGISYPAADANAFSVGSVNGSDVISEFSQRSANLDLLAPGEGVRTTALGGGFNTVGGTSFSAPALTGTIALMHQVDASFSIADIQSMLHASSPTNFDGDQETGDTTGLTFQRLDVYSTLNLALNRASGTSAQAALIGKSGSENDLVFDKNGVLHFLWYDDVAATMKYATRSAAGNWSKAMDVDDAIPNVGTEFSMKLDSFGKPVIAYLDSPNGDLKVARFDGTQWNIDIVDSKGVTGLYPSLAIDSSDRLYISYFRKTARDLKLATFENGIWSRSTIDADGDVGWSSTIALDNNGDPAIGYGDAGNNRLKIARRESNVWSTGIVDGSTLGAAYISLAFNSSNVPSMSYYEVQTSDLKLATESGSGWSVTRIASKGATGLYTNLELDDNGVPSILYWDRKSNSLIRVTKSGKRYPATVVMSHAGRFTMTTKTNGGQWMYATSNGVKLVLATI